MHTDLNQKSLAERLRALPTDARPPYDWNEFQRRSRERDGAAGFRAGGFQASRRYAAIAAAVVLAVGGVLAWVSSQVNWQQNRTIVGAASGRTHGPAAGNGPVKGSVDQPATGPANEPVGEWAHPGKSAESKELVQDEAYADTRRNDRGSGDGARSAYGAHIAQSKRDSAAKSGESGTVSDRSGGRAPADSEADAIEFWLASLPKEPVVVRVGTRAAVAGLEDRIAQIDDLLSAERANGKQSAHLASLQQQRAQLISSLVQVRYAETLVAESR